MGIIIHFSLFSCICLATDSTEVAQRKCITDWADKQTEIVRELSNRNDSKYIDEYFKVATGSDFRNRKASTRQWCAVFVTAAYKHCKIPIPVKGNLAAVRTWEAANQYVLDRTAPLIAGDIVTFKFGSHIGLVKDYNINPRVFWVDTYEGNTTDPNDRRPYKQKQQGAYQKRRLKLDVKKKIRIINSKKS